VGPDRLCHARWSEGAPALRLARASFAVGDAHELPVLRRTAADARVRSQEAWTRVRPPPPPELACAKLAEKDLRIEPSIMTLVLPLQV
jgi:hypothetical protein